MNLEHVFAGIAVIAIFGGLAAALWCFGSILFMHNAYLRRNKRE